METLTYNPIQPEIEQLHVLNKKWLLDINYVEDEMNYLKILLEKYFSLMLVDPYVNRVQLISMQLDNVYQKKHTLKETIKLHDTHLECTLMNIDAKSIDFLKLENERIETLLNELHRMFKAVKADIFQLTK